jgi:hypothetical protein
VPLKCRIVAAPPPKQVHLAGAIDEHSDVTSAFSQMEALDGASLVLNLEGVIRINSIGLRQWIPLLARLCKARSVVVEGVSYPFVLQANNVSNVFSSAQVKSCVAPYYCSMCEASRTVLVQSDEVRVRDEPPEKKCPDCGAPMEFDELEDYFAFLRRRSG